MPDEVVRAAGSRAVWHGQRSRNGIAILACTSPVVTSRGLPGDPADPQARYLEAAVRGGLLAAGVPAILAGDYDASPIEAGTYPSRSCGRNVLLQPAPRAAYAGLLASGWTDAVRTRHPGACMRTLWDSLRNRWPRDAGLRIDHVLLSPALAPRLRAAGVDCDMRGRAGASDHAPAWIERVFTGR